MVSKENQGLPAQRPVAMAFEPQMNHVMTATHTHMTDARRPARWNAGTHARARRRTAAAPDAGTECERATRHATTATASTMTDAARHALWRPGTHAT